MLTLHIDGKVIYTETFNSTIRIQKQKICCVDRLVGEAYPISYIDYDEYEFIGKDPKGEYHYQLKEPNHGLCKGSL